MTRIFLSRTLSAIDSTIEFLFTKYANSEQQTWNLSNVMLVVPSARVRQQLLYLLLLKAEQEKVVLEVPIITTIGSAPEHLYRLRRPLADGITQRLAWYQAVERSNPKQRKEFLPVTPDKRDLSGQLTLGQILCKLHEDLGAEMLSFSDIVGKLTEFQQQSFAELGDLNLNTEINRWKFFAQIEKEYLAILDAHNLWDTQVARRYALAHPQPGRDGFPGDFEIQFDIVLAGIVDLNRVQKAMLERVGNRVTALIYATQEDADGFDSFGAINVPYWSQDLLCPLKDEQIIQVEKPMDQALCAMNYVTQFQDQFRFDEMTIGVPDENMIPYVRSVTEKLGIPIDDTIGVPLTTTAPYVLLQAIVEFIEMGDFESFAALVRHPSVYSALSQNGDIECREILTVLDNYQQDRFPFQISSGVIDKLEESQNVSGTDINTVRTAVHWVRTWLSDLFKKEIDAKDMRQIIAKIFAQLPTEPYSLNRQAQAVLINMAGRFETIPEDLTGKLTPISALHLILLRLESYNLPDEESCELRVASCENAKRSSEGIDGINTTPHSSLLTPNYSSPLHLAGWLELVWDRSPILAVMSFNEGIVPQSSNANLFLPNQLRRFLGIMDNDRRLARDAYFLHALAHSGKALLVICSKIDTEDKSMLPSRLLFNKNDPNFALKALRYFDDKTPMPHFSLEVRSDGLVRSEELGVRRDAKRSSEVENGNEFTNSCGSTSTPHSSLLTPHSIPTPHSSLLTPNSSRLDALHWAEDFLRGDELRGVVKSMSATKFVEYLKCPFRFYLRFVVGVQPTDYSIQELPATSFGTLVHEVLQTWAEEELSGGATSSSTVSETHNKEDELFERLSAILDRIFVKYYPANVLPGITLQKEVVRQRLKAFAAFQAQWEGEIIATEETYTQKVRLEDNSEMTLLGRIDRIDRMPDGSILLLDYKTSDTGKKPEAVHRDKEGDWISLQLPVYRQIIQANRDRLGLGSAKIRVGYINISKEKVAQFEEPDWDESDFNSANEVISSVMESVHNGIFWPPTEDEIQYDDYADYVNWLLG